MCEVCGLQNYPPQLLLAPLSNGIAQLVCAAITWTWTIWWITICNLTILAYRSHLSVNPCIFCTITLPCVHCSRILTAVCRIINTCISPEWKRYCVNIKKFHYVARTCKNWRLLSVTYSDAAIIFHAVFTGFGYYYYYYYYYYYEYTPMEAQEKVHYGITIRWYMKHN